MPRPLDFCLISDGSEVPTVVSQKDRFAKIAASRLRRGWREGAPRVGSAPRDSIASAERALRARRRRRLLVRRVLPAVTSAMALGGLVLAWPSLTHRPLRAPALANDARALVVFGAAAHGGSSPAQERPLGPGDQVFAPRAASVTFGDTGGTQLTLEPGGMLTVLESSATRRFSLRRGAVGARVHKLAAGERFIIETADAEIEVHGTKFRVAFGEPEAVPCSGPGPAEAVATRVTVSEGVVTVKWAGDEQRLLPGDEWPPQCPAAAVPPPAAELERPAVAPARAAHHRAMKATVAAQHEPTISALEAQNNLFVAAVRARREGRTDQALVLFNRFIQNYPGASLFEGALAQKMRLLAATQDRTGAAATARQYLGRFPEGFARDEARTLLGAPDRP